MKSPLHRLLALLWMLLALPALAAEQVEIVSEPTGRAVQSAIDACNARGGGRAYLPPGRYVTGPLWLKDNVELRLEAGAVVVLSPDKKDWPAGVRALVNAKSNCRTSMAKPLERKADTCDSGRMRTGALFLGAFGLVCLTDGASADAASSPGRTVPLWGRFEASVTNTHSYPNPFTDVTLRASFTRPDRSQVAFSGFHDGDGHGGQTGKIWKLRFMPDQVGRWSYEASFPDGAPGIAGRFECVARDAKPGPLRVDPANSHFWKFADGSRFYARPYTAPEIFVAGNEQHWRFWVNYFFGGKYRFNFCNANLLNFVGIGEELNWQGTSYKAPDPLHEGQYVTIKGNGLFPFCYSGARPRFDGGSNVDWSRPSIACWANVDKVIQDLEAHQTIWFNHWGMLGWDWSGNGRLLVPPEARKAVLRYWIARLAPYWNVTWNIAGEWDELFKPAEFDALGSFIKESDPWKHPLTSHALATTVNRPWVDFRVEQFSAGTSSDALANARHAMADYADKPVFAFETSWEATPGKLTADKVRAGAWGSVMGGAFYLYAECFEPTLTWGDGQAFRFIELMEDFLTSLRYWELKPDPALVNPGSLCLVNPGKEYVIYRQTGGPITLDCSNRGAETAFTVEWLNTRTGARTSAGTVGPAPKHLFRCPDTHDWVLHLSKVNMSTR